MIHLTVFKLATPLWLQHMLQEIRPWLSKADARVLSSKMYFERCTIMQDHRHTEALSMND